MNEICHAPWVVIPAFFNPEWITATCDRLLHSPVQPLSFNLAPYLMAFVFTCLLELPFYFFLLRNMTLKKRILILFLANLATHPLVYFVFPTVFTLLQTSYLNYILCAEVFAPVIESLLLVKLWRQSFGMTVLLISVANLFSWGVGTLWIK